VAECQTRVGLEKLTEGDQLPVVAESKASTGSHTSRENGRKSRGLINRLSARNGAKGNIGQYHVQGGTELVTSINNPLSDRMKRK